LSSYTPTYGSIISRSSSTFRSHCPSATGLFAPVRRVFFVLAGGPGAGWPRCQGRKVSITTEDGCPRCLAFGHLGLQPRFEVKGYDGLRDNCNRRSVAPPIVLPGQILQPNYRSLPQRRPDGVRGWDQQIWRVAHPKFLKSSPTHKSGWAEGWETTTPNPRTF
jgi:hypothetical protein